MLAKAWLALCLLLLAGCLTAKNPIRPAPELPRPTPGYTHWLQKQSMLAQAQDLIGEVTQSQRLWLQSGEPKRARVLLEAAPNWLDLDQPQALRAPVFRELARLLPAAAASGFGGLYLGDTGEKPDLWRAPANAGADAPVSLAFAPAFGDDSDYEKLADAAEAAGLEIGSSLLPGATGLGPDFFLQARNVSGHGGLYSLLPVPPDALALLPASENEWDGSALSEATVGQLVDKGALPEAIARDSLAWTTTGGWAVTGPVMGADGVSRRWLYRYSGNPRKPVLSWQDPSGQAEKVLRAAAIRTTGLLGQSLAGLRFEPLMGLEPGEGATSLEPGLSTINDLSRQIHRYGGWALQADPVPPDAIQAILAGPCDFCRDDITALLAAFGMLMADGRPLASLYRGWLAKNVDISRLARGFDAANGVNPALLAETPEFRAQAAKLSEAGAKIDAALVAEKLYSNPDDRQMEDVERFLMVWRTGLPGLVFMEFAPGDLSGERSWLANTLKARQETGLAYGAIHSVIRGRGGGFGLLTSLPGGGYWLLACNFGINRDELALPASLQTAIDAASGEAVALQGGRLALDGRAARNVIFKSRQALAF